LCEFAGEIRVAAHALLRVVAAGHYRLRREHEVLREL
jgi:hypothetical protein